MKINSENYASNFGAEYANSLPTLAESMVFTLRFFDCKRIYGVGGDFAANLIRAFENDLDVLPSSNEMHAGFTACGQAEVEGMGFCLTTYTVGSLPCSSAVALAKSENLPVVFISGAPGESETGSSAIHHTVTSFTSWNVQYDAALNSFRGLGVKAERLQGARSSGQPNLAGEQFFNLVAHAYSQREPVVIEIPRDLVFLKTQALARPKSKVLLQESLVIFRGLNLIAQEIASKLRNSKFPLVYLGENLKLNPDLVSEIVQFCEKLSIPYASGWFGKGLLDELNPLSIGSYNGAISRKNTRKYIETKVDYVLEIGTSIFKLDTNNAFNSGTHVINDFENKTVLKGTSTFQQDLVSVINCLKDIEIPKFEYNNDVHAEFTHADNDPIDFHNLTDTLNHIQKQTDKAFIYFPEIGNSYFTSYGLKVKKSSIGRSWICNSWYGAMGTSLPYARATSELLKANKANDATVVITGDGGFHFQLNELIHFMKSGLSVIIIYMRNNIFHLGKNSDAAIYKCNDENFDVIKLISAYGGEGKNCSTVGEFIEYFKECTSLNSGIKLIEITANPIPERLSREIRMLNLYISASNGIPDAVAEWEKIVKI